MLCRVERFLTQLLPRGAPRVLQTVVSGHAGSRARLLGCRAGPPAARWVGKPAHTGTLGRIHGPRCVEGILLRDCVQDCH